MEFLLRNVTLRQLQIFLIAAENNSFAVAAQTLHLSQPAVSLQMKRLSEMLEITLFERDRRNVKLTAAGNSLLQHARRIHQYLNEASEDLQSLKNAEQGTVNIGMVTTTQYFGPKLIEAFCKKHPGIKLDISIANRKNIIEKIEANQIDLAIMGRTPSRLDVSADEFYQHPYVLIAPPNHPLSKQQNIRADELSNEQFLTRELGSGTRMIMDNYFFRNNLPLPSLSQFNSNEAIKQAVMANMGLAFISSHTIEFEKKSGLISVLNVQSMPAMRSWLIVNRSDKHLSPAARAFKEYVNTQGASQMQEIFA